MVQPEGRDWIVFISEDRLEIAKDQRTDFDLRGRWEEADDGDGVEEDMAD